MTEPDSLPASEADIIVVGLGMSAGPLIERLLKRVGLRLVVLDRGPIPDTAQVRASEFTRTVDPAVDQVLLRTRDSTEAVTVPKRWAPRLAGGGWLLWYGQVSRFRPSDFTMASRTAGQAGFAELRDWPVSLPDLEPWYEQVEQILTPVGCAYGYSPARYQELDCRHLSLRPVPSHFEKFVIDSLRASGIRGYSGQTCLGGRAWDYQPVDPWQLTPRPDAPPLELRANWHARALKSLGGSSIARLQGETYVTRLLIEDGEVKGVRVKRDGTPGDHEILAGTVVLGCGALETIRIMLASELPDSNGLLGRRFTFTAERNAYLVTREPRSASQNDRLQGLFASVVVKDYYDPPPGRGPVKGGKLAIYDALAAELPERHASNIGLAGVADLNAFLDLEARHYVLKISFKGESIPWEGKFVELSDRANSYGVRVPMIHYDLHPEDHRIGDYACSLFEQVAVAFPGSELLIQPARQGAAAVSAHQHGGAVFGQASHDAVLSPSCECFEAKGLFVIDGSFMPTSGATNSSLTLMANAMRIGDVISRRLSDIPQRA